MLNCSSLFVLFNTQPFRMKNIGAGLYCTLLHHVKGCNLRFYYMESLSSFFAAKFTSLWDCRITSSIITRVHSYLVFVSSVKILFFSHIIVNNNFYDHIYILITPICCAILVKLLIKSICKSFQINLLTFLDRINFRSNGTKMELCYHIQFHSGVVIPTSNCTHDEKNVTYHLY